MTGYEICCLDSRTSDLLLVLWWYRCDGSFLRRHLHFLFLRALGGFHTVLGLPLLQHFVQIEAATVVYEEVLHLHHRLVADDIGNGLEIPSVFPYS